MMIQRELPQKTQVMYLLPLRPRSKMSSKMNWMYAAINDQTPSNGVRLKNIKYPAHIRHNTLPMIKPSRRCAIFGFNVLVYWNVISILFYVRQFSKNGLLQDGKKAEKRNNFINNTNSIIPKRSLLKSLSCYGEKFCKTSLHHDLQHVSNSTSQINSIIHSERFAHKWIISRSRSRINYCAGNRRHSKSSIDKAFYLEPYGAMGSITFPQSRRVFEKITINSSLIEYDQMHFLGKILVNQSWKCKQRGKSTNKMKHSLNNQLLLMHFPQIPNNISFHI